MEVDVLGCDLRSGCWKLEMKHTCDGAWRVIQAETNDGGICSIYF